MRLDLEALEARLLLNSDSLVDPVADIPSDSSEVPVEVGEGSEIGDEIVYFSWPVSTQLFRCSDEVYLDDPISYILLEESGSEVPNEPTDETDEIDEGTNEDDGNSETTDGEPSVDEPYVPVPIGPPDVYCKDDFDPSIYYTIFLAGAAEGNPLQGPDEAEPNDELEEATPIELQQFPTFAPGVELFGADIEGIGGGATGDQDAYSFELLAGQHVDIGVTSRVIDNDTGETFESIDEWIAARGLNSYGDAPDIAYLGGTPLFNEATGESIDRLTYILANHPELTAASMHVAIYVPAGNEVASSENWFESGTVFFDAESDGTYYALVSVNSDASSSDPVEYHMGILAQSGFSMEWVLRGNAEPPQVITLKPGDTFEFTDSDGDEVEISFDGRGGRAEITFTGGGPDGSDIALVEISGVRRGGNLSITADDHGSADVGSVSIENGARGSRRSRGFGRVEIDGNLGSFSSDVSVRALVVDGLLGEVQAASAAFGRLTAEAFDLGMSDIGSIGELSVDEDSVSDYLRALLSHA
jgi:hypothetical protein